MFPICAAASPNRNNAGGIAASVIVVLLLIGTLVGLLVFYLRTRQTSPFSFVAGFTNESYDTDLTVSKSDIQTLKNICQKAKGQKHCPYDQKC